MRPALLLVLCILGMSLSPGAAALDLAETRRACRADAIADKVQPDEIEAVVRACVRTALVNLGKERQPEPKAESKPKPSKDAFGRPNAYAPAGLGDQREGGLGDSGLGGLGDYDSDAPPDFGPDPLDGYDNDTPWGYGPDPGASDDPDVQLYEPTDSFGADAPTWDWDAAYPPYDQPDAPY